MAKARVAELVGDGADEVPASDRKVTAKDNAPPEDASLHPKLSPRNAAGRALKSFVERIERLEEEKKGIADDVRDVYAEAKGMGFETKVIRIIIKERKTDKNERDELEALLDVYRHAMGMGPAPEED